MSAHLKKMRNHWIGTLNAPSYLISWLWTSSDVQACTLAWLCLRMWSTAMAWDASGSGSGFRVLGRGPSMASRDLEAWATGLGLRKQRLGKLVRNPQAAAWICPATKACSPNFFRIKWKLLALQQLRNCGFMSPTKSGEGLSVRAQDEHRAGCLSSAKGCGMMRAFSAVGSLLRLALPQTQDLILCLRLCRYLRLQLRP